MWTDLFVEKGILLVVILPLECMWTNLLVKRMD